MADQLTSWLKRAGFRGEALRTAWAIAMRESGGRADAFNGNQGTGDQSYGLFQINMLGALGPSRLRQFGLKSNDQLLDPLTNAKVAFRMSKGGKDWGAWAYGPNAYRNDPALTAKVEQYKRRFPGAGVTARTTMSTAPAQPGTQVAAPQISVKQLNQIARQFGFKSFAQAFGFDDDGHVAAILRQNAPNQLPMLGKVGQQGIPVVNGTGKNLSPKAQTTVNAVVKLAHQYLGTPYVWGGKTPGGFDCSGLVQYVYGKMGIKLPGYTIPLYQAGRAVKSQSQLREGDAVFFHWGKHPETGEQGPLHMGMYIGNGLFIQAPRSGDVVKITRLSDRTDYVGARRYV